MLSDLLKEFDHAAQKVMAAKKTMDDADAAASEATAEYNAAVSTAQDVKGRLDGEMATFMPVDGGRVRVS